ncbi:MAG: ABC transporter ATP-binding protein [Chitinophagales bacterium]
MSEQVVIQLTDICKVYRLGDEEVRALDHISLQVSQGEFVAIMGASGSGKSTLLNLLGCLDRPTSGQYCLAGQDISRASEDALARIRNRYLGFVFQSFNLLPQQTALENVELPQIYAGVDRKVRRAKALEALAMVGLEKRVNHRPRELSGGQQQRVAIARSLMNDPQVLLADEPTGNLDSRSSDEIMAIFRRLNEEGITIVMVTHEDNIANYASRRIRFKDGRIISDDRQEAVSGA